MIRSKVISRVNYMNLFSTIYFSLFYAYFAEKDG